MIDYKDNGGQRGHPINIWIGEEEWHKYSMQNKVRLLYRLRESDTPLAQLMAKSISQLVEEEQRHYQIDYDATIKRCEDVRPWQE